MLIADKNAAAAPVKRPLTDKEREELFKGFLNYMNGHYFDWDYFYLYFALFRKIGNSNEFMAELEKADKEMAVLESEAQGCNISFMNRLIKPIPTRHQQHQRPQVTSNKQLPAGSLPAAIGHPALAAAVAASASHHLVAPRISP
jgi:hypothetical protein